MNRRSVVLFVLLGWGCVITPPAVMAGKLNPAAIYSAQASALVFQTLSAEFGKRHDRPADVLVTVTFQLDRRARVHNLVIIPRKGGQWAEDTARKLFNTVRFAPAPQKVFDELGKELIDVHTDVGITSGPSESN
jgi:hypothetical protein